MMYLPSPAGKFLNNVSAPHLSPPGRSPRSLDSTPVPVVPPRMEVLLHALTAERGRCRRALESLQNAHETILTLEAQVARREAELEIRDHQCIADVKPIPQTRTLLEGLHSDLPEVPLLETVHSLSIAEEHNRVLEQEVGELNDRVSHPHHPVPLLRTSLVSQLLRDKNTSSSISVAVQTSPPDFGAPHPLPCSPPITPMRTSLPPTETRDNIEDMKARIDLLSHAIDHFAGENRATRDTFESGRKPTDTRSDPLPTSPSSILGDNRVSSVPHSPPKYQLPPEIPSKPPSSQPPPHKTLPDFQHILRVEQECLR